MKLQTTNTGFESLDISVLTNPNEDVNFYIYGSIPIDEAPLQITYRPLRNLLKEEDGLNKVNNFETDQYKYDFTSQVQLETQKTYDGSTNLIFTDNKSIPRLVNSRFRVQDNNTFTFINREKNSNLYDENTLAKNTSLQLLYDKIPQVDYLGMAGNGNLKCGSYFFFFRYADLDKNVTDIVAQSNRIIAFIGDDGNPKSVHGGIRDENSNKTIRLKLSNLDTSYNYIQVCYQRITADKDQNSVDEYKQLVDLFPYDGDELEIRISGFENTVDTTQIAINQTHTLFTTVKSFAQTQNRLFAANCTTNIPYDQELKTLSLQFLPFLKETQANNLIGEVSGEYEVIQKSESKYQGEYYNSQNQYYYLGYMPGEFYRLGIVYIYNNGQLSNVYNIRGHELNTVNNKTQPNRNSYYSDIPWHEKFQTDSNELPDSITFKNWEFHDNGYVKNNTRENEKGVIYINPDRYSYPFQYNGGVTSINTVGYYIYSLDIRTDKFVLQYLKRKGIMGYFFVRQKRMPLKLTQMFTMPMIQGADVPAVDSTSNKYTKLESFLSPIQLGDGQKIEDTGEFKIWWHTDKGKYAYLTQPYIPRLISGFRSFEKAAGICPDLTIKQPYFNQFLTGDKFTVKKVCNYICSATDNDRSHIFKYYNNGINPWGNGGTDNDDRFQNIYSKVSLISVPEDVSGVEADGKIFRSSVGSSTEARQFRFIDNYDASQLSYEYGKIGDENNHNSLCRRKNIFRGIISPYIGIGFSNFVKDTYSGADQVFLKYPSYNNDDYTKYYHWQYKGQGENFLKYGGESKEDEYNIANYFPNEDYSTIQPSDIVDLYSLYNVYIPEFNINNMDNYWEIRLKDTSNYYQIGQRVQLNNSKTEQELFGGDRYICWFTQRMKRNFSSTSSPTNDIIVDSTSWLNNSCDEWNKDNVVHSWNKMNVGDLNAVQLGNWITLRIESNYNLIYRSIDDSNVNEKSVYGQGRGFYPVHSMSVAGSSKLPETSVLNDGYNVNNSGLTFNCPVDVPFVYNYYKNRIYYSEVAQDNSITNGYRSFLSGNHMDYNQELGAITKIVNYSEGLLVILEHGIIYVEPSEKTMISDSTSVYLNYNKVLPQRATLVLSTDFGSKWIDSIIDTPYGVFGVDTVAKKIWMVGGIRPTLKIISDFVIESFLNKNINLNYNDSSFELGIKNVKSFYNAGKQEIMFTFYNLEDKKNILQWNIAYNFLVSDSGMFTTFYSWIPTEVFNIDNNMYSINADLVKILNDKRDTLSKDYPIYFNDEGKTDYYPKLSYIWKHGESIIRYINKDIVDKPYPTKWYDIQFPFEFEFIVRDVGSIQKIFNNLLLVSNNTEPESFSFTVTGDGYEFKADLPNAYYRQEATKLLWREMGSNISYDKYYTNIIPDQNLTVSDRYTNNPGAVFKQGISKSTIFPAYYKRTKDELELYYDEYSSNILQDSKHINIWDWSYLSGSQVIWDTRENKFLIQTIIKCNTRKKYGILKSNSEYTEGLWKIQIPYMNFVQKNEAKWSNGKPPIVIDYIPNDIKDSNIDNNKLPIEYQNKYYWPQNLSLDKWTYTKSAPLRDKWIKVRIRYSGKELAIISGIKTIYTQSFS